MKNTYDIIVIGGGHAGSEAALVSARKGCRTLLITMRKERVVRMSCNPAVGGLAKGHLVKEVDALGGEIGRNIDRAGIQFRMLNRGKGPAVWSPRAQADKELYSRVMLAVLEAQTNLDIIEGEVSQLVIDHNRFAAVVLETGPTIAGRACILTAGTFLRGLMHIGETKIDGGREGDPSAKTLSASLRAYGFRIARLKTGTPPRILARSVDLSRCEPQTGDTVPTPFSHRTASIEQSQVLCHLTHTSEAIHEIIRGNLNRSPLYCGEIKGIGPRYCPSIEDKVVRFPDKLRHQIFVEPEGRTHPELYLNGLSTSLPSDVQLKVVRQLPGFGRAIVARWGYAIEYDFFPPDQIRRTLESKDVGELYFAGQVNGTSGYEEAAAQGFIAGINAVLSLSGKPPFTLRRDEAYIGVLIDDLTTKEIDEPYRMFTSRAEFRLLLRQDNADERLMPYGHEFGLIAPGALDAVKSRKQRVERIIDRLRTTVFPGKTGNQQLHAMGLETVTKSTTLYQLLKRPGIRYSFVKTLLTEEIPVDDGLEPFIECRVKYEGYIERQQREIQALKQLEARVIPGDFPYETIAGLSTEARQKLIAKRPETVSQASRISGVRAADLSIVAVHLERLARTRQTPVTPQGS